MPGKDGTGLMGTGALTGGGFDLCVGGTPGSDAGRGVNLNMGWRRGRGCERGLRVAFAFDQPDCASCENLLTRQKAAPENRPRQINNQLENLWKTARGEVFSLPARPASAGRGSTFRGKREKSMSRPRKWRKIAESLVHGRIFRIEGGEYQLCDGLEDMCRCDGYQRFEG